MLWGKSETFRPSIDTRTAGYSSQVIYEPHHKGLKMLPAKRFSLRNATAPQGCRLPSTVPSVLIAGRGFANTTANVKHAGSTARPRRTNHIRRNTAVESMPREASNVMTGPTQIAAIGTCRTDTYAIAMSGTHVRAQQSVSGDAIGFTRLQANHVTM